MASNTELKSYTLDEVKKHNTPEDCWIAVDGRVRPSVSSFYLRCFINVLGVYSPWAVEAKHNAEFI